MIFKEYKILPMLYRPRHVIIRISSFVLLFASLLCFLTSCDSESNAPVVDLNNRISDKELLIQIQNQKKNQKQILYFGFDLRSSPQEDSRQYQPFLRYLEKTTGYKFELRFTPQNSSIIDELGTGKVHFAALGAVSYIQGHERYGIRSLVRGLNLQGKAKYQSMIVVNPNSSVNTINNLKNKRLAFGNINSTQGHLIPRISLQENGIELSDLKSYKYTGSHQNCADLVLSYKFDACGMQDTMAKEMEKQGLLKVLHTSRYYPSSGIAANQDLPLEMVSKVKMALIAFDPQGVNKSNLYHWSQTEMPNGFISADKKDYLDMTKWLIKFGMLKL